MKRSTIASLVMLTVALAACDSLSELTDLEVPNENNPDRERVVAQAQDIEGVIGGALLVWWEGVEWSEPSWALSTAADEGTMSWGNFGMQQLSSEPRVSWPNDAAWTYRAMTEDPWYAAYGALSSVYDGLRAIDANPAAAELIDVDRARAFAKVVQGLSHGFLALMYDSSFIFDETVELFEADGVTPKKLDLLPYPNIMAKAIEELEEAISIATAPGVSFTTPDQWMDGNPMSAAELAQLANSIIARLMTQVARTPGERQAVLWSKVIGHVDDGITSDVNLVSNTDRFWRSLMWYGYQINSTTWARADYKTIGWLDTSGNFANWLALPVAQRNDILITTPDRRVQGTGGSQSHGTDFRYQGGSRFPSARGTYHYSMYGGSRYANYPVSDGTDPARWMTVVEMQLIKAEGLLRTGGAPALPEVVDIINSTRVTRGQLPAATVADADLMDKLIYEKRIEGYLLCSGCAYFDRRGFGPVAPSGPSFHQGPVQGTPLHFAPPGLELNVLEKPLYTYGGAGNEGGTLQPSASPGLRVASSSGVPATLIYRPRVKRGRDAEFTRGAAELSQRRQ